MNKIHQFELRLIACKRLVSKIHIITYFNAYVLSQPENFSIVPKAYMMSLLCP